MLQVLSTSIYALSYPLYTLSFVTPLLSLTFEIFPEVFHDPVVVSTPLGENGCYVCLLGLVTHA